MKNKKLYLEEDKDILNRLSELNGWDQSGKLAVGVPELQILALLRTRKTYQESSEVAEAYSRVIFFLTCLMFVISLAQLILFSATLPDTPLWARVVGTLMITGAIAGLTFWIAKKLDMRK